MNSENQKQLEALQDIRHIMQKSTRFLSLSGLSGIFAGIYALTAYIVALWYIKNSQLGIRQLIYQRDGSTETIIAPYLFFIIEAIIILFLSLVTAYYFSSKKAKKNGQSLFDHAAIRVLINLCIPLVTGGLFCIALLYHGSILYIAPAMLLFYGLALINASKYTYDYIRYLGLSQITIGIISAFDLGHGLFYWALGFGVLHIIYGTIAWFKYDKKNN